MSSGNSWGGADRHGYAKAPHLFIRRFPELGLKPETAMLVLCIESFRFDDQRLPFPSVETLAASMGWSRSTIFRHLTALKSAALVIIRGRDGRSSAYDFAPLYSRLEELAHDSRPTMPRPTSDTGGSELRDPPFGPAVAPVTQGGISPVRPEEEEEQVEEPLSLTDRLARLRTTTDATSRNASDVAEKRAKQRKQRRSTTPAPPARKVSAARARYQGKKPHEYNANDMWFVLYDAWLVRWPSSKPGLFTGKDRNQGKQLIESYGAEVVAAVIHQTVEMWPDVMAKFRVNGFPSMAMIFGYRNSLVPWLLEEGSDAARGSPSSVAGSQFDEKQDRETGQEGGW